MCCGRTNRQAPAGPRKASGTSGTATQAFSLILKDGTKESFGSRLEADAANARAGYTGIVRQNSGG